MQLISSDDTAGLEARVHRRLSACLDTDRAQPLAVGLSGGGDSLALLHIVSAWAKVNGRQVLALTVDHRLNPDSKIWTQQAGAMARACGAQWRALEWAHAKGGTGIQARARQARHAMLARAAREAGAAVLLLGHTLDDAAENDLMREEGGSLGRLRLWSPSPVWPEGMGVTLLRPLLDERRDTLREYLRGQGLGWIDDPANEDGRYARVRARAALSGQVRKPDVPQRSAFEWQAGALARFGVFEFERDALVCAPSHILSMALLCCGGGQTPPRGERLASLRERMASGEDAVAVLCGTRIEMQGHRILMMREAGELKRRGAGFTGMPTAQPVVWDGRFTVRCDEEGWEVGPSHGFLNRFNEKERAQLQALPAAARLSLPVLHNPQTDQYLPVWSNSTTRCVSTLRFHWNLRVRGDETTQEAALFDLWHGETGASALFSR